MLNGARLGRKPLNMRAKTGGGNAEQGRKTARPRRRKPFCFAANQLCVAPAAPGLRRAAAKF